MDERYERTYRELYERHWWWRAREAAVLDLLRSRQAGRVGRILDVGCGDGLLFDALAPLGDVDGVEGSEGVLDPAGRHRDRIFVGPLEAFSPAEAYDLALMLDVLEHLEHPAAALSAVHRLLRPGGALLVTVPAFMALWTSHDDLNRHVTRFDGTRLRSLLEEAGFAVELERYWFQWTCLAKLAQRWLEGAVPPSKPALPVIPPEPVNSLLAVATRLELRTLGRLPLPFGTSAVAFCRRR